jgi:hypothetical protein
VAKGVRHLNLDASANSEAFYALDHLASMIDQKADGQPVELWQVRKGEREFRCVVYYLSSGIDVRLMEGDDFRRTQLCKIAPEVEKLSEKWLKALVEVGWNKL